VAQASGLSRARPAGSVIRSPSVAIATRDFWTTRSRRALSIKRALLAKVLFSNWHTACNSD
jgi:hypothetical protein